MKLRNAAVPLIAALFVPLALAAQEPSPASKPDPLAPIAWLAGDWIGTGEGQPGVSAAQRRIARDINGKYLRIESRSVYPRQEKNPKGEVHVSLDLWSYDRKRQVLVLRQFDSLGFVSTYVQDREASATDRIVLRSEHIENVPDTLKARYTYTFVPPDEYRELFELDESGKGFETYVSGRFLRIDAKP